MIFGNMVPVGDIRMRVHGQGPVLVFCHGFTTTSEFWREQLDVFAQDYRVLAINLPGHGISPAPQGRTYTMDAYVRDLEQVFLEMALEDAVLVGLSMGGTVAQHFALRNPEMLRALVLVGATPHGLGPDVDANNVLNAIASHGIARASQDVIERSFGPNASPDLIAFAKNEVLKTPQFVAEQAIVSLNKSDTRQLLPSIDLPTLVVCGEEDIITPPKESRVLAESIPDAQLCVIPDAGHFPMLEKPAAFNSALRTFLNEVDL